MKKLLSLSGLLLAMLFVACTNSPMENPETNEAVTFEAIQLDKPTLEGSCGSSAFATRGETVSFLVTNFLWGATYEWMRNGQIVPEWEIDPEIPPRWINFVVDSSQMVVRCRTHYNGQVSEWSDEYSFPIIWY